MRQFTTIIFVLYFFLNGFSQKKKVYFSDTIFQYDQMRIETTGTMAYKTFGKVLLHITNLTDSFKIIYPKDVSVSDIEGKQIACGSKTPVVIPPKMTRKCRFMVESTDFKTEKMNIIISNVYTTDKPEVVYNLSPILFDKVAFDLIDENKVYPYTASGHVAVQVKSFEYFAKGNVTARLLITYNGGKFLGINPTRIKLKTPDGRVFVNQKHGLTLYNIGKTVKLDLEFENPSGNKVEMKGDNLILEDIFTEYGMYSLNKTLEFKLSQLSESEIKSKEEEKQDIEIIED